MQDIISSAFLQKLQNLQNHLKTTISLHKFLPNMPKKFREQDFPISVCELVNQFKSIVREYDNNRERLFFNHQIQIIIDSFDLNWCVEVLRKYGIEVRMSPTVESFEDSQVILYELACPEENAIGLKSQDGSSVNDLVNMARIQYILGPQSEKGIRWQMENVFDLRSTSHPSFDNPPKKNVSTQSIPAIVDKSGSNYDIIDRKKRVIVTEPLLSTGLQPGKHSGKNAFYVPIWKKNYCHYKTVLNALNQGNEGNLTPIAVGGTGSNVLPESEMEMEMIDESEDGSADNPELNLGFKKNNMQKRHN